MISMHGQKRNYVNDFQKDLSNKPAFYLRKQGKNEQELFLKRTKKWFT